MSLTHQSMHLVSMYHQCILNMPRYFPHDIHISIPILLCLAKIYTDPMWQPKQLACSLLMILPLTKLLFPVSFISVHWTFDDSAISGHAGAGSSQCMFWYAAMNNMALLVLKESSSGQKGDAKGRCNQCRGSCCLAPYFYCSNSSSNELEQWFPNCGLGCPGGSTQFFMGLKRVMEKSDK